ncbi:MAG: hotdog fold thioesterase [Prevotella sp.]|nr:hotdog fold thioesterase [Prevotella sp.]MBR1463691.1 hotdog fold thioesterase [Prevotella sp.]
MTLKDFLNNGDVFAKNSGARIVEIREGYARAEMTVTKEHLNAGGVCQGGALFTLADLVFAAISNSRGKLTFGLENTITFLHSAFVGDQLTAEATETLNHHKIPYCEIKVKNQHGDLVCSMTGIAYRKEIPTELDGLE